jgi:uncharacterized membrane protein
MLTRFVLYGFGGWCGEILFTALTASLPQRDWRLTGRTYLWMFPIYGLLAPLYEPVHELIRDLPLAGRAVVWSLGFTTVEYISGWMIERVTGRCPWDYVANRTRYAINAYIRWDYFPLWAAVGLALERAHDMLVHLTPAIEAALGLGA